MQNALTCACPTSTSSASALDLAHSSARSGDVTVCVRKFNSVSTALQRDVHKQNRDKTTASAASLRATIPKSRQHAMDLAQERGASSWLTTLPLEEFGLTFHKGAFRDAIALRYGWQPALTPSTCACGTSFSVEHALSCPMGGFPILRHNEVRDLTAKLMSEVCHDVCIEPTLQQITGEALSGASAITEDGARLDVAANGFWGGCFERAFFDVRVLTPMLHETDNLFSSATENAKTSRNGPGASAITEDGARLDVAANGFWGGRFERAFFDVRVFNPHAP